MNNPYAEAIREVREKLNYFRRQERILIKNAQRCCPHHQVERKVIKTALFTGYAPGYAPPTVQTHYKAVCKACGKRMC